MPFDMKDIKPEHANFISKIKKTNWFKPVPIESNLNKKSKSTIDESKFRYEVTKYGDIIFCFSSK